MTEQKYSSNMVKELLENTIYNFWSSDWSRKIKVKWDSQHKIPLAKFRKDVIKLVGRDFMYELSLNGKPVEYQATLTGLIKF